MQRRRFVALAAATASAALLRADEPTRINALDFDREAILRKSGKYLAIPPKTPRSSNPQSAGEAAEGLPSDPFVRLSVLVPTLTCAWRVTQQDNLAQAAIRHLDAWFIDPSTRIEPATGIVRAPGRLFADSIQLVEVSRSVSYLAASPLFTAARNESIRKWFADTIVALTESKLGVLERDNNTSRSIGWTLQAAEFARLTGNDTVTTACREIFQRKLLRQISEAGTFPEALTSPRPYGVSLAILDALAACCQVLSTPFNSLWDYQLQDGRGLRSAIAFHAPFIQNKRKWPYKADVEYFAELPMRHISLLLAARAYQRPEYLAIWKERQPHEAPPDLLRDFPVHTAALWNTTPPA